MRAFSVVLAAVVAATAMAGKYHDSSRPCFRKSEARDEVITGPRMHEALDMSAVPTSLDWRAQLKGMGGSISAARQQVSPLLKCPLFRTPVSRLLVPSTSLLPSPSRCALPLTPLELRSTSPSESAVQPDRSGRLSPANLPESLPVPLIRVARLTPARPTPPPVLDSQLLWRVLGLCCNLGHV